MDLRRLEIYYRVVEAGGFTKAAKAMALTQPTLSAAVRQLEDDLAMQLLNRLGREVVPTAAGHLLHGYARRIFALRQEAITKLKAVSTGEEGELLLGASTIPGSYLLPDYLADFRERYPKLRIRLNLSASGSIVDDLRQRRLELALIGGSVSGNDFESNPCFGDELVVIVPAGHSWGSCETIEEKELAEIPLLLREEGSATRKTLESRLKEHGVRITPENIIAEVSGNEALKQGVLAGLGVAVISKMAVAGELHRGELVALQLASGALNRSFYLLQLKGLRLSVAAGSFKKILLEAARFD